MQKIQSMIDKYVTDASITVDLRINCKFKDFMDELPHNHNGIYIIYEQNSEDTTVVYVGKGKIKTRQKRHRQKLIETPQK